MSSDTVGRAFALARSGTCRSVDDIRRKLAEERCDARHMLLALTWSASAAA